MSKHLTLKQVKEISPNKLLRLINKAKEYVKDSDVWIKACKEYDQDPDIIDLIPTMFGTLDVSAKTDHGIVILNYKLLCDGDFIKDYSYMIHEYSHYLQQTTGTKPTKSSNVGNYLENEHEQEGFQNQVEYIADEFGENKAEKYVDDLLDHHDVEDDKKEELEDIFLANV